MTPLQPAGAALESLEAAGRHVALLVAEIERLAGQAGEYANENLRLAAERNEALARLSALEKQEPIGIICGKRIEPNGTSEFFGFYFDKGYNPTLKEKIYAAAGASPVQPSQAGLSDKEIRKWWASENGLEDMDLCKIDDFTTTVRAIEKLINAKGAAS